MTALAAAAPAIRLGRAAKHRSRTIRNAIATACIVASFLIVLVPLVFVIGYVVARGHQLFGYAFLTKEIPTPRTPGPGMGPAVLGTLLITGAATVMAVPLGVLGGVYLSEYGRNNLMARVLRFFAEVMTGVPSIVMGLFIFTAVLLHGGSKEGLAGALALGCLMLPIVIRTTDEMLRLVPAELREGSVALGSRQARTILRIVLPAAAPGIVSGALLAVARAAGETAPLLFVIGSTYKSNRSLFGPNTSLSVQIFSNATSSYPAAQQRAWTAALTLIAIVFIFTVLARLVTALYSRRVTAQ